MQINWEYVCNPELLSGLGSLARNHGTLLAGALFSAGWWFWADACMLSPHKVPFDQYIPGLMATLALLMINVIRKQDLDEGDPFDDAGVCRPRLWLFLSYLVSFGSVVGSVWVLVEHYEQNPDISSAADKWPGVAGILQCSFILGSGLLLFVSRGGSDDDLSYGAF
uniref:Transmembrane protein 50A n=1 Tax=Dunaliella tertiolecta TaxID=3047 RepID=A0A7S3R718_DUNTE|mmetsp:Transcript_8203/g.21892  ORF Transcript_8203/g.21892 Transcript_8203/m.21892 type:complete len:166 (+) Transcript_8203:45-542(+)|eukprot:CAMPEP_0202340568 /NCGR_PEP_ID=MMETSP1126-20121109/1953_1 /ASSEMBLY_ACC=CAM_ASM_000457 /TAXON_ID=3047 /ORGANISM="Dunaliella tertiolecta, Strain CCMP1320" /LENGTH=165 /DNA_ID=CAMNT_0048931295 /DNA_START=33 /DNA_END=530 /DNA_ORIENTATION=-